MNREVLARAAALADTGEPFALATVVWRRAPSSGRAGSKALITPDGDVVGWLGGACAEPTVVRSALEALADGRPRLLFTGPADELDGHRRPGVTAVPMACESEGAMEIYIEPVLPDFELIAIGGSPAAQTMVRLAADLGWRATLVDEQATAVDGVEVVRSLEAWNPSPGRRAAVVVATQGHYDERALRVALASEAGYVGLVASRKRAATVLEYLRSEDVSDDALARVHAPAGMDLGSVEPNEIAVAVIAEIVALKSGGGLDGVTVAAPALATDPVCGMSVDTRSAQHVYEHEGTTFYFCAASCRKAFMAEKAGEAS